ncbi:hypothetical protein D6774_03960 [Candidatus Woesearchaeota archaeon]|nr:MAG: hypothetical protein D6774_03960 [Candidatus Woesearchaeota archaeon]
MTIIFFYGTECATCHKIEPTVDKIAQEKGVEVVKKETYHNAQNQEELMRLAEGKCSQLPFIINTDNDNYLCGDVSEEEIQAFFS